MLKIWGHRAAPNVAKVLWTCGELGLEYELVPTGGPNGGLDALAYRRLNPNGLIPTLDDDGFILWESHAIMRYLARRERAENLYPAETRPVARVDQWLDWQAAHVAEAVRDLVRLTIKATGPVLAEQLAHAEAQADALFGIIDQVLRTSPYIAGADFTLADIPIGVAVRRWTTLPVTRAPLPALDSWADDVLSRPGAAALSA
ncbi:glutathione S-transferase family protein [Sphingomonas sp. QA11]|uniref:glutathione S-transferase family protein n=1 Tax=Sphingomonas sp. QA11 TaxID=2950605 RepID=UPI00234B7369|nr:glutathione S-transferase family protein [Sphingomonas sp. QA11]WCM28588.1 glutathione S-transferase family protein [Sphingomonas sp. QA11]